MFGLLSKDKEAQEIVEVRKAAFNRFKDTITRVTMETNNDSLSIDFGDGYKSVAKGVKGVKCSLNEYARETTIVNVVFDPGSEMRKHKHSDKVKHIYIFEGDLYVKLYHSDGEQEFYLGSGQSLKIQPGTSHYCKSINGSVCSITWQPKFRELQK